jgi:hypothetical protein
MSAVMGQGDPITPARDSVASVRATPARNRQVHVAPATFSAPAPDVASATRPRRTDRTLTFSDQGRTEFYAEHHRLRHGQPDVIDD